jgi:NAD(P)-dependent dehydrogenase (short-subunit alcohol dehydrogenase family)
MQISDSTALVTGANRGLGRTIVEALLDRGAERVYAAARNPESLREVTELDPERVVPLALDLADQRSILAAAEAAPDVNLLVNNAGHAAFAGPMEADPEAVELEMATNYLGTYGAIRAWAPLIEANGGGAIVNVLSLVALASFAGMAGYSASKAATHSLTQSLRPVLAPAGIVVHGVYPGGMDTEMLAGFELEKAAPRDVAETILDGVESGQEDVFPGAQAERESAVYLADPKSYERHWAALV